MNPWASCRRQQRQHIYVADLFNSTIRKVTPAGVVTTLAGVARSVGGTDGTGSVARFDAPGGITIDPSTGILYVADSSGATIRAVTSTGVVTTLAGTFNVPRQARMGTGSAASFNNPHSIVADGHGNLFVADNGSHAIIRTGNDGRCGDDIRRNGKLNRKHQRHRRRRQIQFSRQGITIDGNGNLYVADSNNEAIREITSCSRRDDAGRRIIRRPTNGTGTAARFQSFRTKLPADGNGNIYVADSDDFMIRKIAPGAVVSTFAGVANVQGSTDGSEGTVPEFNTPEGVTVDANDNTFVADTTNNTIREITPTGFISTLAGIAGTSGTTDGTGSAARFNAPTSVALRHQRQSFRRR